MRGPVIEDYDQDIDNWNGAIAYLDRDGVLNYGRPNYINSPEELDIIDGVKESIQSLRKLGYKIVIVTNQSAIMRGLWDEKQLKLIHQKLIEEIGHVDVLKVDVEGAEYEILYSLLESGAHENIRSIYVEDHERKMPSLRFAEMKNKVINGYKKIEKDLYWW